MTETTRDEHLRWCKNRAIEYVDRGEIRDAFASMSSDLSKHPDTKDHPAISLGTVELVYGRLWTSAEMRKFIEGFH